MSKLTKLEIRMLGSIKITVNGKSVIDTMSSKAIGIFCYLLMHHGKFVTRDKLAFLFWDNSSTEAARYNLRHALWSIRKIIKEDAHDASIIVTNKDRCRAHISDDIHIDVLEMEALLKQIEKVEKVPIRTLEAIDKLYSGEFLDGFYIKGCPEFNDWIYYERERLQKGYFEALHKLAVIHRESQHFQESIEAFEKLLRINPLHEELYAELMEVYLEMGDRHAVLNLYKRCSSILREELNISPGEKIYQLYSKIRENKSTSDLFLSEYEQVQETASSTDFQQNKKPSVNRLHETTTARQIPTVCPPIDQMHYSWMADLTESIIICFEQDLLKDVSIRCWKELSRICLPACQYIKDDKPFPYGPDIEKLRIFQALEQLLLFLMSKIYTLDIFIENFQWIDATSYGFIKYFFNRHQHVDIRFNITGEIHSTVIKELEQLHIRFDVSK
ncbi:MAG: AfsR/SARP family transcriptional regulator [Bacillota bacterium]